MRLTWEQWSTSMDYSVTVNDVHMREREARQDFTLHLKSVLTISVQMCRVCAPV